MVAIGWLGAFLFSYFSVHLTTHQVLVNGLLDGPRVLPLHLGGLERVLDVQRRRVVPAPLRVVRMRGAPAAAPVARAALPAVGVTQAAVGALRLLAIRLGGDLRAGFDQDSIDIWTVFTQEKFLGELTCVKCMLSSAFLSHFIY